MLVWLLAASFTNGDKEVPLVLSNGAVYNVTDGECAANSDMCFTPALTASKNEAAVREILYVAASSSNPLTEASLEASFQAIVNDASDSFDLRTDETMTLELTNDVNVRALSVGLYIGNIEDVSPHASSWQFEGRLYVREIMPRPYTSREQAIRAIYRNPEAVMDRPDGTSFADAENWDDKRHAFECNRNALDSARDLTSADFDNVFRLEYENVRGPGQQAPQYDPEGQLKYIRLKGDSYSYRPQHSRFPFSTERLKLTSDLEFNNSKLAFNMLCVDPSFTGFAQPDMISWPSREVARASSTTLDLFYTGGFLRRPPFLRTLDGLGGDSRIRYGELHPVTRTSTGMLVTPLVEFTIVLTPTRLVGFFMLMPLFAATLATQLQWKKPVYAIDESATVSSILLISGAIAAHLSVNPDLVSVGFYEKSIADECAYIITGWYIVCIAVISGRNAYSAHAGEEARVEAFKRGTARLYSLMRQLGLLATVLFVPAVYHSVDDYGRTDTEDEVWITTVGVLGGAVTLLTGVALFRYRTAERHLEATEAAKTAEEREVILPSLDEKSPAEWSVLEVAVWLEHSPALVHLGPAKRATVRATFTKEEIEGASLVMCTEMELLLKLGVAAGSAVQVALAVEQLLAKPLECATSAFEAAPELASDDALN